MEIVHSLVAVGLQALYGDSFGRSAIEKMVEEVLTQYIESFLGFLREVVVLIAPKCFDFVDECKGH